jgi:hypothetical protein
MKTKRIYVNNVYADYYRPGKTTPDFTEKVIAFEIVKGELTGIVTLPDGTEDCCERQRPQYEPRYYGKS